MLHVNGWFFFFKEMGLLIFDLSVQKEKTLSNASENSLDVLFWYTLKKGLRFYSNKKHLGDIYQLSVCPSVCISFYIMDFFFKPISTKLSKKHHCVMAIQICKMRQLTPSSKGYSLQLKKMETRSYEEKSETI